jgi:hypothetical protein
LSMSTVRTVFIEVVSESNLCTAASVSELYYALDLLCADGIAMASCYGQGTDASKRLPKLQNALKLMRM